MPVELSDEHKQIHSQLMGTISAKTRRNKLRLDYYDMKHRLDNIGFSIPDDMKEFESVIGWAAKAVNVPVDRIRRTGFSSLNKDSNKLLDELQAADALMRLRYFEGLARHAAALFSCSFMFFTPGDETLDEQDVVISVKDARNASAMINPRTGRVTAALEASKDLRILYLPGETITLTQGRAGRWEVADAVPTGTSRVRCTVYRWREELSRPFGYSRINRAVMTNIDRGVRSILRQETNAEFYSSPRGILEDAHQSAFVNAKGERIDPMRAIGAVWGIPGYRDIETGDMRVPTFKQLAQASFQPHTEMLRSIAMNFHAETDIPMGQLGVIQDNPSSADAIRASEHGLLTLCTTQIDQFSYASMDAAYNVLSILDPSASPKTQEKTLAMIRPKFANPATMTPNSLADAGSKFVGAFPDLAYTDIAYERFGLDAEEVERAKAHLQTQGNKSLLETALEAARSSGGQAAGLNGGEASKSSPLADLKLQADALGALRRAGVTAESAAKTVGLQGLEFMPGAPVTIREPASDE